MPRGDGWKRDRRPVVAHTRKGTVWYATIDECCKAFGIVHHQSLIQMMETGQVGPDGWTTFDEPIKGVVYEGMSQADMEVATKRKNRPLLRWFEHPEPK